MYGLNQYADAVFRGGQFGAKSLGQFAPNKVRFLYPKLGGQTIRIIQLATYPAD